MRASSWGHLSPPLVDNHGRVISYLRLAITDRCNLRCRYCMPAEGVHPVSHDDILSLEEIQRLAACAVGLGISKIRVTGGEPVVRRGWLDLLRSLAALPGLASLHLTTNGVELAPHVTELARLGVRVNLSLDTLDPARFHHISRRDRLAAVQETLAALLDHEIPLKINVVVQGDTGDDEIRALAALARSRPLTVRFIERMPFCGDGDFRAATEPLRERLARLFPGLEPLAASGPATASLFRLDGHQGRLGIIEGYARRFCATCNKIRITPTGTLKTCLYDDGVLDLRAMLRQGAGDRDIQTAIRAAVGDRAANGFLAEARCRQTADAERGRVSMATIGG